MEIVFIVVEPKLELLLVEHFHQYLIKILLYAEWIYILQIGTNLEIGKLDGHQKRISAKVVKFPFYDPEKSRVKA